MKNRNKVQIDRVKEEPRPREARSRGGVFSKAAAQRQAPQPSIGMGVYTVGLQEAGPAQIKLPAVPLPSPRNCLDGIFQITNLKLTVCTWRAG